MTGTGESRERDVRPSVFSYAARHGATTGLVLSALTMLGIAGTRIPALDAAWLVAPLYMAFAAYRAMMRTGRDEPEYARFWPQWLTGMYTLIFATLVCSLVAAVWLVFVQPDFVRVRVESQIAALSGVPGAEAAELRGALTQAVESGRLPSPMQFVFAMMWMSCFYGSIVSLPVTGVAALLRRRLRQGVGRTRSKEIE